MGSVAGPEAQGPLNTLEQYYRTCIIRFALGCDPGEVDRHVQSTRRGAAFFAVDMQGNLYIPDHQRLLVRVVDGTVTSVAGGFENLRGARVCRDGSILLTDDAGGALYRLRASGTVGGGSQ